MTWPSAMYHGVIVGSGAESFIADGTRFPTTFRWPVS